MSRRKITAATQVADRVCATYFEVMARLATQTDPDVIEAGIEAATTCHDTLEKALDRVQKWHDGPLPADLEPTTRPDRPSFLTADQLATIGYEQVVLARAQIDSLLREFPQRKLDKILRPATPVSTMRKRAFRGFTIYFFGVAVLGMYNPMWAALAGGVGVLFAIRASVRLAAKDPPAS